MKTLRFEDVCGENSLISSEKITESTSKENNLKKLISVATQLTKRVKTFDENTFSLVPYSSSESESDHDPD